MAVRDKIISSLKKVTSTDEIHLETPEIKGHGDYATNVALILAKEEKKKPQELAKSIKEKLEEDKTLSKYVSKVEVAGPGFINFFLSKDYLLNNLEEVNTKKDEYGKTDLLKGKKYLLEHTSPDPIKTIHIGHLRNNFLGMSMANIMKFLGAKVTLDLIDNDRGIHVNKAMYGYLVFGKKDQKLKDAKEYIKDIKTYKLSDDEVKRLADQKEWKELLSEWIENKHDWYTPKEFELSSDKFDNAFYSLGQRTSELVDGVEDSLQDMLKVWEDEDKNLRELWKQILEWSYKGYEKTYKRIGSHHDKVWHESDHYNKGKKWIEKGLKKGIFVKTDDGAVLSNLESYGLTDTIVLKKDGTGVYHTQDLHLTYQKVTQLPSDLYIWDIGNEQKLYMKQLFAMCDQLGIVGKDKLLHLNYGFLTLKGGAKMSSRYGSVVNADELLDDLASRALKVISDSDQSLRGDMSDEDRHKLAEKVGLSAVKYGFLRYSREKDAAFDMEESLNLYGNSGPYLLYTYARCQSVLKKKSDNKTVSDKNAKIEKEEEALLRAFVQFPEVLEGVVKTYSPNTLCNYLYDLAQKYNTFYDRRKIIGSKNEVFRIDLTMATGNIIKNGLNLLGIDTPERM